MPLERLMLILVAVAAAAGATIWAGYLILSAAILPGWVSLPLIAVSLLVAYVVIRVILERLRDKEDDHYDRIEK